MTEEEKETLVGDIQEEIFLVLRECLVNVKADSKEEVCAIAYEAIVNAAVSFALLNGDEESLATMLDTGTEDLVKAIRNGSLKAIYEAGQK